jgi:hypothetical protein
MPTNSENHSGGCLCGAVRFRAHGELGSVVACHCSQCRRQSGHFWASTDVRNDALEVDGAEKVTWYSATPGIGRGFCSVCGSFLFWKRDGGDHTSVGAGMFDPPTSLVLTRHIYCADKGDYYAIDSDLPQFSGSSAG